MFSDSEESKDRSRSRSPSFVSIFKNKSSVRQQVLKFFETTTGGLWANVSEDIKKKTYKNFYHKWYMANKCKSKPEYNKRYYQKNKDKLLQWQSQWREKNRPRILAAMRAYNLKRRRAAGIPPQRRAENTIDCMCGGRYTKYNKSIHFKTKTHQRWLNEN